MFEFQIAITENAVLNYLLLIISYAILGGGIKYIDDAFDEKTFSIRKAIILAPLLGIFWGYLMSLSPASATILLAIVLGVFFTGKIDNVAHMIGLLCIVAVVVLLGYFQFMLVPLVILTLSGIADELGNDYADKKNLYAKGDPLSKFLHLFFEYRFTMKVFVFSFAYLGFFGWEYFLAFIAFDLAYAEVMQYSKNLIQKGKFTYMGRNHKGKGNGNSFLKGIIDAGR